jgi:hypothetical protein
MSAVQRYAWFNLTVIGATVVIVAVLVPFLGPYRATGGLGFLGLLGLSYFFIRPRAGQIVTDERDLAIQRRSRMVAYSVFWVVFVLTAVFGSPWYFGTNGAVPVNVVRLSVAAAWILVETVSSLAILVQYARSAPHAE